MIANISIQVICLPDREEKEECRHNLPTRIAALTHNTPLLSSGERFSFILFTPDAYNMLLPSIAQEALKLGFTAASSKGVDDPYFQNFRDLGKVLKAQGPHFFSILSFLFLYTTCFFWGPNP